MEAANRAITNELGTQFDSGQKPNADTIAGMRSHDADWSRRQVCAWHNPKLPPICSGPVGTSALSFPTFLKEDLREIVRDHGELYLRSASIAKTKSEPVYVVSSEPLDRSLMEEIANNLGEITLYGTVEKPATPAPASGSKPLVSVEDQKKSGFDLSRGQPSVTVDGEKEQLSQTYIAGSVPAPSSLFDREITFGTPLPV